MNRLIKCGISVLSSLPVCLILSLIGLSYYDVVFILCQGKVAATFSPVAIIIPYHILLLLFLWSFWQSVFTKPTNIPKQFYLNHLETKTFIELESEDERNVYLEHLIAEKALPIRTLSCSGNVQFCDICFLLKPDRTHHCSNCIKCVPKMDHHCPWINNCVGHHNQKHFVLFLLYGVLYCLCLLVNASGYFVRFLDNKHEVTLAGFQIFLLFILSGIFSFALLILLVFHMILLARNKSTLEWFRSANFRPAYQQATFDLGCRDNFIQVFGRNPKLWALPIHTSANDGIIYPARNEFNSPSHLDLLGNMEFHHGVKDV